MKCKNCEKEMKNPLKIIEINIKPEIFLNKEFCDEPCLQEFIRKNIKSEELRGSAIEYKTSQEI